MTTLEEKVQYILDESDFNELPLEERKSILHSAKPIDAVPVVRCRDCKFRSSWMMNRNLRYICPESGMFPNCENDFCSYGKRKGGKDHA